MRLLQITSDWKWTGPAEPLLHAVTGLRERGHEVELACPAAPPGLSGGILERALERGVEAVHRLGPARGYVPLRDGPEVRRLRAALELGGYALVHAHHARAHLLTRLAARPLGIPVVASWPRGEPIPERFWNRALYGRLGSAGLVTLSESLARHARGLLGGDSRRVGVVPGAVDAGCYAPRQPSDRLRAELGLAPAERVVGVVARLQPHRRFDLLLEALVCARREAPGLRLLVVGRGTRALEVLDAPVRQLGLGDAVIRAGYRRDDFRDVLALLDALVFLVPGSDGSCRAVLEAMAMEVPTIASRRGVLPETVVAGRTGELVDERVEALAAALGDVWRNPADWAARGKAARERVLAHFTVAHQAERLEAFYSGLPSVAS